MKIQASPLVSPAQVDATRYALLRRLGFVFRHHLVGGLQPLNIMCRVMHLKLKGDPPDIAALKASVDQAIELVRTATSSCLDVVSWLSVETNSTVGIGEGIGECLSHLRSSFALRGFSIQCEDCSLDMRVSESALREVLTAAVIAAGDEAQGRSDIVIGLQELSDAIDITLKICKGMQESVAEHDAYRLLGWEEVQSLAWAHHVGFERISSEEVRIRMPRSTL